MAEALIGNLWVQLKYLQKVSKDRLNHRTPPIIQMEAKVSKNILDQRNQGDFSPDTDPKLKNVVEGSKIKTYTKSSLVL